MLSFVRKAARSWVAAVLIGLLVISFTIWGINDVFKGNSKDNVALVAGKAITSAEFRAEFDKILKRASKDAGKQISIKEAREQGGDTSTLERMVGERAFNWFFDKLGLKVATAVVQGEIKKISAFEDPATHTFSDYNYQQLLAQNGMDPTSFEQNVRYDMGKRLMTLAATSGFRAPKYYSVQTLAFGTERRLISMIPVPASLAGNAPVPTDAQINTLYEEVKPRIMRPETRDLTIVLAKPDKFIANAKVDPNQVKQIFETQKAKLGTPSKRTFVQIVAQDKAKADEAANRLKAGEAPEAITKALGLQAPLNFTDSATDQIPDKDVANAVFAAKVGDVGSVKGALSFSAFKVSAAKAEIPADFAKASPEIIKQLSKEVGAQALSDAAAAFDDAIAQGDDVEKAAAKVGFEIVKMAGVTAQAIDPKTNQPLAVFAQSPDALAQAFQLAQGDATDLISAKDESYIAIRADKINASSPVPLAEIKTQLAKEWTSREIAKRLKEKADAISKEASASGLEAAAKKFNLTIVKPPKPLLRGQGGQELGAAVFTAKKGAIVNAPMGNGVEYAIIRIDGIVRDDENKAPDRLAKAENSVRGSVQQDLADAIDIMARKRAKAKTFPDRMKALFGDETESAQPAKK